MKHIVLILSLLIFTACSNKGLIETNQKKIYLSNTKVYYDIDVKSFKINFSINNYTKETINNFVYQIIFKDEKGVVITTAEEYFSGVIESKKAKRATILIDDYTRKNFKSFDIEIKK
tara:strand:- start:345 stop:695 length:351 start_codon:yes stop_codon:yes gene_type:complete